MKTPSMTVQTSRQNYFLKKLMRGSFFFTAVGLTLVISSGALAKVKPRELTPGGSGQPAPIQGGILGQGGTGTNPGTGPIMGPGGILVPVNNGTNGPVINGGVNNNPILGTPITINNLNKSMVPGVSCPLVDGTGSKDILAAAQNLHLNLASLIYQCGKNQNNQNANSNPYVQLIQNVATAAATLKKYTDDPLTAEKDPNFLMNVETNLTSVMNGVSAISTALANNQLVSASCNVRTNSDVIQALGDLVQSITPIAMSVLQTQPEFAPAIPYVIGVEGVASMVRVIGKMRSMNMVNVDDPKVRLAILQNVCEYGRITERIKEARLSANSGTNQQIANPKILKARASFAMNDPQFKTVYRSMTVEAARRKILDNTAVTAGPSFLNFTTNPNSVINNAEIDHELKDIEMALFNRPSEMQILGVVVPLPGEAPVYSWFRAESNQFQVSRDAMSAEMKHMREVAARHYVDSSVLERCSNLEDNNGRVSSSCSKDPDVSAVINQINSMSVFNLRTLQKGTQAQKSYCDNLYRAISDWQATMDHLGALTLYCSYLSGRLPATADKDVLKACMGDQDYSQNVYGSNMITALDRDPRTVISAQDAALVVQKFNDLGCGSLQ